MTGASVDTLLRRSKYRGSKKARRAIKRINRTPVDDVVAAVKRQIERDVWRVLGGRGTPPPPVAEFRVTPEDIHAAVSRLAAVVGLPADYLLPPPLDQTAGRYLDVVGETLYDLPRHEAVPPGHFRCDRCGGVFEMGRPDEEACAEAEARWGAELFTQGPAACVCDDCFKAMGLGHGPS